jgi:hypothetical protein
MLKKRHFFPGRKGRRQLVEKMVVAGIVAEYNPFHNGHALQIELTRAAGATHIVTVMSGNFIQRGVPACAPKTVRANAAAACGVDLVLELPLPYAMATAERFAFGALGVLGGRDAWTCFRSAANAAISTCW